MTWTAPTDRTMSTFLVLQTPVTSAPNDLAICTAKVPTPPDAPLIKTRCPGWTRLPSHQFRRPPPRNREPRWSEDPILAGTAIRNRIYGADDWMAGILFGNLGAVLQEVGDLPAARA